MISFHHVSKRYSRSTVPALLDATFELSNGEILFVLGPSGSGKSTLLKMVIMEELPDEGQVVVGGYTSSAISSRKLPQLRRKIGMVFQDFRLLRDRNIFDNVALPMRVAGIFDPRRIHTAAGAALAEVGLYHRRNAYPAELSGGEQQRVAIARAIVNEPLVVLADEPTGNLDHKIGAEIFELLRRINRTGTSVVVATHDEEMTARFGQRVLRLEEGHIISDTGAGTGHPSHGRK
jgi:cell division transport system ATP-binding protein